LEGTGVFGEVKREQFKKKEQCQFGIGAALFRVVAKKLSRDGFVC
jgi:hypothetical protein